MKLNSLRYRLYYQSAINSLRILQSPYQPDHSCRVNKRSRSILPRRKLSSRQVLEDLVALLQSLAASIRSGMDPLVALERSGSSLSGTSYLGSEVRIFIQRLTEEALPLDQALNRFADQIDDPCLDLFRHAIKLAYSEGASVSACLQRLSRVTRQRQSFDRKVKSALAMQKLSTIGLIACAALMLTTQALINFEAIKQSLSSPLSLIIMMVGLSLLVLGGVMMALLSRRCFA